MRVKGLLMLVLGLFLSLGQLSAQDALSKISAEKMQKGVKEAKYDKDLTATIKTSKGDIKVYLFATQTPQTVYNFAELAKAGYYDGLNFHRVIPNFMIQGGCPLGTGRGNPGYYIKDETRKDLKHFGPGTLSMANADPNTKVPYSNTGETSGSQFFITHVTNAHLDGRHSVFGQVVYGQDVVNSIGVGDEIISITIHE